MNIADITKTTAKNMYEMMMQLASHIETLEAENAELKQKLEAHNAESK
jgi:outer membrane murein-binding lipoprotein Lpp